VKVAVVSHAQVQHGSRARWRRLAEAHDADVTILVPALWKSDWFGVDQVWRPEPVDDGRFHVRPIPTTNSWNWSRYLFRSIDAELRRVRPDIIYVVQEELTLVLQQMMLYRSVWARSAKLVFFSWNNLRIAPRSRPGKAAWARVRGGTDAAIAGTEEIRDVLMRAGYRKPIHVQTEIGIDGTVFHPDAASRERMRRELRLSGFVIGFSGRLVAEKGVRDLVAALDGLVGDWSVLLVGDGALREEIAAAADRGGWRDRLVLTGHVELDVMPELLRSMDCLVLPSRTTPAWKEQFGLVLAQAMACGVPVIGSDSGAIPEVVGDAGDLFPEGDASALRRCLVRMRDEPEWRATAARRGMARAAQRFSADGLASDTFRFFSRLLGGTESIR